MKREILFRGKRVFDNKFEYGYLLWHCLGSEMNSFINNKVVINETVCQFTGMTDKNGTKIFEGDILNCPDWGEYKSYQVFWDVNRFSFLLGNGYSECSLDEICQSRCEVIGNIYDNKELLK